MVDGKNQSGTEVTRMPTATRMYPSHQQPIQRGSSGENSVAVSHANAPEIRIPSEQGIQKKYHGDKMPPRLNVTLPIP